MDPKWQDELAHPSSTSSTIRRTASSDRSSRFRRRSTSREGGPYANYNWELFFHIPLTIAVHLSKTQRFAEAQRWFHYIFDPTSNDKSVDPPSVSGSFRRSAARRTRQRIDELLALLSKPDSRTVARRKEAARSRARTATGDPQQAVPASRGGADPAHRLPILSGDEVPGQPDRVGRLTLSARHDRDASTRRRSAMCSPPTCSGPGRNRCHRGAGTAENLRPARSSSRGSDGQRAGQLEGQFPFDFTSPPPAGGDAAAGAASALGRALYFCVPRNDKLLGYWDTVADRSSRSATA